MREVNLGWEVLHIFALEQPIRMPTVHLTAIPIVVRLLALLIVASGLSCGSPNSSCPDSNSDFKHLLNSAPPVHEILQDSAYVDHGLLYFVFGHFCGECISNCTRFYGLAFVGDVPGIWTDDKDSFFKEQRLSLSREMGPKASEIGIALADSIPKSILNPENPRNVIGCPDCDDRCGLYFEFQLKGSNSRPFFYKMEYDMDGASEDLKFLGTRVKFAIGELEQNRNFMTFVPSTQGYLSSDGGLSFDSSFAFTGFLRHERRNTN